MTPAMAEPPTTATEAFTTAERAYIRSQLDMFFSTYPTVADGFQLKTWRNGARGGDPGGDRRGSPKIPAALQGLLERRLMRLDTSARLPRAVFTEAGLAELRAMMGDRRLANPVKFAHVRRELEIDPES